MVIAPLYLQKRQDRRISAGHLWVYSNEVDVARTPLNQFEAGQLVMITASFGKALGIGYINPHTLLCARLLTRDPQQVIDQQFFATRIQRAKALRDAWLTQPYYRLVYGESDELPGLIVDRYGDVLVVQLTTAGMERFKSEIIAALTEVLSPRAILLRNDHSMRELEGLDLNVTLAMGELPQQITLHELGATFMIAPWTGQKTGWFYDHRDNRSYLSQCATDKSVLDLFSYVGAWSIQAALAGAREVIAVDSSAAAIEILQHNAALNQVSEIIKCRTGDVFEQLKILQQEAKLFDVVIVDPPAFIKRRKDADAGFNAYLRVNELAMKVLKPGGLLISSSCSLHLAYPQLIEVIARCGNKLQRHVQIIKQGHQAIDHPVHPAISETNYLKALFCRVW